MQVHNHSNTLEAARSSGGLVVLSWAELRGFVVRHPNKQGRGRITAALGQPRRWL